MLDKLKKKFSELTQKELEIIGISVVAGICVVGLTPFIGSVVMGLALGLSLTNKFKDLV